MAEQLDFFAPKPPKKPRPDIWGEDEVSDTVRDLGLRWYQEDCVEANFKSWADGNVKLMNVLATGLGKTQIAGGCAAAVKGRVLFMAHRDELVQQARDRFEQMLGEYVEVEQAGFHAGLKARIVVASTQSLTPRRLEKWPKDHFELVIADEFHHYLAKTYRRAWDHFTAQKKLGVTATPDRGDGKAMGQIVDDVSYVMDILQGIEHGYLVPLDGKMATEVSVDVSDIGVTGGDLTASQLDEKIVKHVEGIVKETLRLYPGRRGPCFFPGVKSAELAAERFNALSPGSAAFIHGGTDPDERRMIIRAFKRGQYQWLCNCQIATEGFDDPTSNLIVLGRPTLSRALYAQMVGRGTRHLPGITDAFQGRDQGSMRRAAIASSDKPSCAILDFCGNSGKHDLMMPEDLLGGKYTDEEREKAKKIAREKGGGDALQNLESARRELRALASKVKSSVSAKVVPFDPFKVVGIDWTEQDRNAAEYGQKPATEKQLQYLRDQKVPEESLNGLSKRAATRVIDEIKRRSAEGLASYKQLRQLQKYGVTELNLTKYQASRGMEYLASVNWVHSRVDPLKLWNLVHGSVSNADDDGR